MTALSPGSLARRLARVLRGDGRRFLLRMLPKDAVCAESGYIASDDYTDGGWWQGGVVRAVDEFVETAPVELVLKRNRQYVPRKL